MPDQGGLVGVARQGEGAMRGRKITQIIFAGAGLCLLLSLQAFTVCEPISIIHTLLAGERDRMLVTVCCQASFAVTFLLVALCRCLLSRLSRPPFAATVVLLASGFSLLMFGDAAEGGGSLSVSSGALLGAGQALGFICCMRIFASFELNLAKALLIVSSLFPIIPFFLTVAFNADGLFVASMVVFCLFPLSMIMLAVALRTVPLRPLPQVADGTRSVHYRAVARRLAPSAAMAFLLGLVGPALGASAGVHMDSLVRGLISQGANTGAALVALLIWFGFKTRVSVPYICSAGFPLLATMLFAAPYIGSAYWPLLLFCGDMLFCLVSIAVMVTCLETAEAERLDVLVVYGAFACVIYLSRVVGLGVGAFANGMGPRGAAAFVSLLLLYAFSLAFYAVARRGMRAGDPVLRKSGAQAQDADDALQRACASLRKRFDLSQREYEVMVLIVRGRNVPAMAELLCVSKNTVRTHVKRVYRALGVHSRQELIDFVEGSEQ